MIAVDHLRFDGSRLSPELWLGAGAAEEDREAGNEGIQPGDWLFVLPGRNLQARLQGENERHGVFKIHAL